MKFLFAGILAFCISCVFSIEIDQNIETDSDQPANQEDSDVSFGKYNIYLVQLIEHPILRIPNVFPDKSFELTSKYTQKCQYHPLY